jgi:hypothetical protein
MTDDEKKAAIEAEYLPKIKRLLSETHPYSNLAALFMAGEMLSAQGKSRAWAESIEKVTSVSPEPPPETTIEKTTRASPVADPIIYLPSLVNTTAGKKTVIGQDFETGADIAVGDIARCGELS